MNSVIVWLNLQIKRMGANYEVVILFNIAVATVAAHVDLGVFCAFTSPRLLDQSSGIISSTLCINIFLHFTTWQPWEFLNIVGILEMWSSILCVLWKHWVWQWLCILDDSALFFSSKLHITIEIFCVLFLQCTTFAFISAYFAKSPPVFENLYKMWTYQKSFKPIQVL